MTHSQKPSSEQLEIVKRKCDFRWDVFEVLVGGKSAIDAQEGLSGFPMKSTEDADRFILSYGFDRSNPIEHAEVLGNFREALDFIRKHFLKPDNSEGLRLDIPRQILELADIRELFLMASQQHPVQKQAASVREAVYIREWACSILKVMHCVAHIDRDVRSNYYGDVQKQIFDRFYKYIHRDEGGKLYLGEGLTDPLRIELIAFETKPKKSRESVLLKLLHKPESVADEIFDRVGIRFITPTPFLALRVVKYLKDMMIVMPANIKPSRSRNTLVDLGVFRQTFEGAMRAFETGQISEVDLLHKLEAAANPPASASAQYSDSNKHTSQFYRSIQFTCRQLIKLENPVYEDLKEIKSHLKNNPLLAQQTDLARAIDRIDFKYIQREVRFFYPFEIQIMDESSRHENEQGASAHTEYKKAQVNTALKRVMSGLLSFAKTSAGESSP